MTTKKSATKQTKKTIKKTKVLNVKSNVKAGITFIGDQADRQ